MLNLYNLPLNPDVSTLPLKKGEKVWHFQLIRDSALGAGLVNQRVNNRLYRRMMTSIKLTVQNARIAEIVRMFVLLAALMEQKINLKLCQ